MPAISPTDYSFLLIESQKSPKHIAPVEILRPPDNSPDNYVALFVEKLRQAQPEPPFNYTLKVASKNPLNLIPGLPIEKLIMPSWREETEIDMEKHVFHIILPKPGTLEQLTEKVQELHQSRLSRERPLWECHVIEGYEGGKRFAVYTKIHHSLGDGLLLVSRSVSNTSESPEPDTGKAFWELPDGVKHEKIDENIIDDVSYLAKSLVSTSNLAATMFLSVLKSGVGSILPENSDGQQMIPFTAPLTRLDRQPDSGRSLVFLNF
ncbi:MAG: hypothetical protein KAI17_27070, partial [Thiotrichaceae bacterium]|nr:hypothetical protein [Thiotrichaceae bacterium]